MGKKDERGFYLCYYEKPGKLVGLKGKFAKFDEAKAQADDLATKHPGRPYLVVDEKDAPLYSALKSAGIVIDQPLHGRPTQSPKPPAKGKKG